MNLEISKQRFVETGRLITIWAAWWPNFKVGESTVGAFAKLFEDHDVSYSEAVDAGNYLASSGEQFLSGPSLLQAVEHVRAARAKKKPITVDEVWARITGWARKGLKWGDVKTSCGKQTTAAIESVGGWDRIRLADTEKDLPYLRKNFMESWGRIAARDENHAAAGIACDVAKQLEERQRLLLEGKQRAAGEKLIGIDE